MLNKLVSLLSFAVELIWFRFVCFLRLGDVHTLIYDMVNIGSRNHQNETAFVSTKSCTDLLSLDTYGTFCIMGFMAQLTRARPGYTHHEWLASREWQVTGMGGKEGADGATDVAGDSRSRPMSKCCYLVPLSVISTSTDELSTTGPIIRHRSSSSPS